MRIRRRRFKQQMTANTAAIKPVVVDSNLITSRHPIDLPQYMEGDRQSGAKETQCGTALANNCVASASIRFLTGKK